MIIYDKSGVKIADLVVRDDSYSYTALMGEDTLNLFFSLPNYVEIPVGSYCDFEGERYTLERANNFKKHGLRNYEYSLILDSNQSRLSKYRLRNTIDKRLKFSFTGKPIEHLRLLVDNLNLREQGWSVGSYIDAPEKVINYNHTTCDDALKRIAEEFQTEWNISAKAISLGKVEFNKDNPLPLSYGRGNGFKTGIGRSNVDNSRPIEVLFVQGGSKNIDASKYGSKELLLPKNQSLVYEGRTYITDADGLSVRRGDKPLSTFEEGSLDCSNISPGRVGEVTSVEVVDSERNFYDFFDLTIPEGLDYSQHRIAGEKVTVIFQTGMLVGMEFEIEQNDVALTGYVHAERRFKLVPQEQYGQTMPNDIFCPKVGDKYAVFGISLPESYICDNVSRSGASWDMFRESVKFLYENEQQRFSFTGVLDDIWSKKNWVNIGGKIKIGGYISFSDTQFQPEGVLIRITGIKRYVNNPYAPEIELSNVASSSPITSDLKKIDESEIVVDELHQQSISFSKRRYRDVRESIDMLSKAIEGFSSGINPIWVQTMSLLVGSESLQFRYVNSKTVPSPVEPYFNYDDSTKRLYAGSGIVQHMTLGIRSISPTHSASEYRYWDVASFESPSLTDGSAYYLYLKCHKTGNTGSYLLTKNPFQLDGSDGFYYLLVGTLSSEREGSRSFRTLYGYSAIEGGNITADKFISPDGKTYINLSTGEIGGKIKFLSGSSGLENVQGWNDMSQAVSNAITFAQNANAQVGSLADYVNGAFADGVIETAEAKAIATYIQKVNESKAVAEASFNSLYNNPHLSNAKKTALLNAKNALWASITNLINFVNSAIADGHTTPQEKASVDARYAEYVNAYSSFVVVSEDAGKSIMDAIRDSLASFEFIKMAMSGSTEVQGGLILSNMMMLKNLAGAIVAGMSGITGDNVFLFADENGGYQKAMNKKSMFLLAKDGTANIGLLKVSKNSIAICEKLVDEQGRFNGLGNEIVRFQDTPIPPFTDLISHVNASVNYYGGTMIHSGAKTGSFGYSDLLVVSGVESFSLKVTGTLYVFVNNDYYTPISDSFCSAALVLYRYENGVYTHERVVDNISIYESVPGVFQDTKQVDISFGLSSGTYAIRGEYIIQTKGSDTAELNIRDFRLTASGSSANKCLIFGSNGFVRIKDGENYTYISDSMVAMKGLPSSVGVVGSGQLYRDSNNFIKVS